MRQHVDDSIVAVLTRSKAKLPDSFLQSIPPTQSDPTVHNEDDSENIISKPFFIPPNASSIYTSISKSNILSSSYLSIPFNSMNLKQEVIDKIFQSLLGLPDNILHLGSDSNSHCTYVDIHVNKVPV